MTVQYLTRRRAIALGAGAVAVLSHSSTLLANDIRFDAATCERLKGDKLRVHWVTSPRGVPIDVAVSPTPSHASAVSVSKANTSGVFEGAVAVKGRPYFHLGTGGTQLTVAERVLPLQGGRNFRDLGGYATSDGRRVRWGTLYRSGTMASLTDADYDYLNALGIRVLCDLRTMTERKHEPDAWRTASKPAYVAFDYEMESQLWSIMRAPDVTPERVRDTMKTIYGTMPYQLIDNYRLMFKELAAGRTPLTFHCSAGKDRTGIATGLLLTALGVPRATILDDYALSDKVVNYEATVKQDAARPKQGPYDFIAALPKEVRAPTLRSDPAYLEATFNELERRDGSVLGFIRKQLGIDDQQLAAMREQVLERV
jgi:protein-tyrosine phosphatase